MSRIKRRVTAAIATAALVPLLAGCYNGFNAGTQQVKSSGDGANAQIGEIGIRAANWVRSLKNPTTMTLVASFINGGDTPDALQSVTTDPKALVVGITGNKVEIGKALDGLQSVSETRVGYNSDRYVNAYGLLAPDSSYVATTFSFANAGAVTVPVLTVPAAGIYADVQPVPEGPAGPASPAAPASPSPSDQPTHSPTGAHTP